MDLGIQRSFTSTMALDVAYVGNHGTNLLGATDLNTPTLGTANKTERADVASVLQHVPVDGKNHRHQQ